MRLRFLAIIGPAAERAALDRSIRRRAGAKLLRALDCEDLSLWTEARTPLLTDGDGKAVAIGLMFDRSTGERKIRLPSSSAELARTVLRDCWGPYVLIGGGPSSHWVLRDPSGAIPVYHGVARGLSLFASDSGMFGVGWDKAFEPNLDAVRQWLGFPYLRTSTTGALGVSELLPGAMLEADGTRHVQRQVWLPADFAKTSLEEASFADAAALLRDEVLRTVPKLAAGEKVTLRLSGGLDSSIVAAALALGGTRFRAVTFATRARDGDERCFARRVASHFGNGLAEIVEPDPDFTLELQADPFRRPPSPLLQPLRRAFASEARGGMTMDGAGGDNIFASLNSASPAVDAFYRRGLRTSLGALHDIAALHGCTFWEAGRSAMKRALRRRALSWPADRCFLTPVRFPEPGGETHPWLAAGNQVPPGSADQIRMIAGIHHFLPDPGDSDGLTLHPLLAQPIVELCLRIPIWFWFQGGRDRAVARAAFRGILPDGILDRRTKGSLETMFIKGYMATRAKLRDFLVGGRLAEQGIVDAQAIAAFLDRPQSPRDASYIRILEIASAEQWLRSFAP